MRILTYQHGLYPRSERVVAATRGLERGRVSREAVDDVYRQDLADLLQVQQEAELDFFSDGLLRWQDIFRPLAAGASLPARVLTRWFDNNAFFRAPEIDGALPRFTVPDLIIADPTVPQPRVATLPSPYMFSRAAVTAGERNDLMLNLARDVLRPSAERLASSGAQLIHLQEPWLGFFGVERADLPHIERALDAISGGLDADVVFHVYFGDAAPYADWLRGLPVHAVGVDLVETDADALGSDWRIGVVAGTVDGRRSVVESDAHIADVVSHVAEVASPPVLYITSNSDLEFLPTEVAQRKIRALGAAARRLKEPVG